MNKIATTSTNKPGTIVIEAGKVYKFWEKRTGRLAIVEILQTLLSGQEAKYAIHVVGGSYSQEFYLGTRHLTAVLQAYGAVDINQEPTLSNTRTFQTFEDAGHGWIKVLQDDLIALGIYDKITSYSYAKGIWAYLEEDCDWSMWRNAFVQATGQEPRYASPKYSNHSNIRNYFSFPGNLLPETFTDKVNQAKYGVWQEEDKAKVLAVLSSANQAE